MCLLVVVASIQATTPSLVTATLFVDDDVDFGEGFGDTEKRLQLFRAKIIVDVFCGLCCMEDMIIDCEVFESSI